MAEMTRFSDQLFDDLMREHGTALASTMLPAAQGIPAGDILVVGVESSGHSRASVATVTSPPAPSCISGGPPPSNGGSGS
jgi:hypothetical protein